jgi:hypothetical protein
MRRFNFDPEFSADVQQIRRDFDLREKQADHGIAMAWLTEVETAALPLCPGYAVAANHVRGEQFAKSLRT